MKTPKTLPDAIARRELLYGENTAPELLKAYGGLYQAADRLLDALEFYHRGGFSEEVDGLQAWAREAGDVFLLQRIEQLTGATLEKSAWEAAARSAQAKGLLSFAMIAFRSAGLEQEALALEAEVPATDAASGATAG